MDSRERNIMGWHGFDLEWWIFSMSFSIAQLREIKNPRWLGLLLCKMGKHSYWPKQFEDNSIRILSWKCSKCKNMIYSQRR